ncbi:MAG: hypothetical protein IPG47_11790 [Thermoflexaceae bacterium]|nr:hypothetical protein [Thermoflexaceae bacterium]
MKVLRLANSNDRALDLPEHQRSWKIAEMALSEAIGEPVETVVREIWPSDQLPDLIETWIQRYEPDLVFFKVNAYWTGYESVPLRIERRLGRFGKRLGKVGKDVADRPVGDAGAFKLGRLVLLRTVGGDTYFTTDYVLKLMEACLRRIIAHEEIVVTVEGSSGRTSGAYGWGGLERRRRGQERMYAGMQRMCREMRIAFDGSGTVMAEREQAHMRGADSLHRGVEGQREQGLNQGAQMARAWLAAHGASGANAAPGRTSDG